MTTPANVLELVERFDRDKAFYKSSHYNETQARQEFIDPLFEALGWDIGNRQGAAAASRDVVLEYSMKIGDTTKAPDYLFRVGGANRFFVEAKKPAEALKDARRHAFQVRRYAWSAQLPLSILTDFEEFIVYDCRAEPNQKDNPQTALHLYRTYEEYTYKWDTIAELFHRDAVLGGSLERFAQEQKAPRGALGVDKAFLAEIDGWRALLAKNIAVWNPELSQRELNYAVQMTLDRLIFLRIGEDRGIEPYGKLQELLKGGEVYKRLINQFRDADDRYNSGLFHFKEERGREGPDSLTPNIHIDDEPLKKILKGLYYPDSPYEFSVLPVEVLGNVYEQFLGKVITIGAGRKVEVEEKPEVRKAGGVYYTPSYIVNYIVKHTVGKLLEGKTTKEAAKLRIVDPACGSGSFLIGAYQYLLFWHLSQYIADGPAKHKKELYKGAGDDWRLTTSERKRILLNNIYGLDIDAQAVEVTKLSLSLKMLEGETEQTLGTTRQMFQERALPDLSNNIKCGNSLIGPEFYNSPQAAQLTDEEQYRINTFNWKTEFPDAVRAGGFDAVIGNPPYIRIQVMKEWAPVEVEEYKRLYVAARQGNYDIYVVFVERGLSLLKENGRLGFILPHKFFNAQYGEPLRGRLAEGQHLAEIVHFGHQQVFEGASTYTCLLFLNKGSQNEFEFTRVDDLAAWRLIGQALTGTISANSIAAAEWNFTVGESSGLFKKLEQMPVKLGEITDMFVGLQTSADTVFLFKDVQQLPGPRTTIVSKELGVSVDLETELLKPVVRSGSIGRYWARPTALVLFPYKRVGSRYQLYTEQEMAQQYPQTWIYLKQNERLLAEREHGKFKNSGWYQLYPKNLDLWEQPKIMMPYMVTRLAAYYDQNDYYFVNVTTGGFGLTIKRTTVTPKYLTGLLNSRLLDWFVFDNLIVDHLPRR